MGYVFQMLLEFVLDNVEAKNVIPLLEVTILVD